MESLITINCQLSRNLIKLHIIYIYLNESLVHLSKLVTVDPVSLLGLRVLEVKVVLVVLVELSSSNVHTDLDLALHKIGR